MPKQSKNNKSAQSANPRPLSVILNESNLHAVILSLCKRRSIHFSDLNLKAIRGLCANINAVALICFYIIDFIHCLKSLDLDTSLRNATLSMTNYCHKKKSPVILRAIARSIHFSELKLKAIHSLCVNLNAVALIRFYIIAFICNLDSLGLDTSLRINATLSMTNYCHKKKNPVILRAIARSIHFGDLKPKAIRLLCANLKVIRHKFTHFGLLRRIYDSPRNDESSRSTLSLQDSATPNRGNPPSTPLLKESKCKLKS